MPKYIDPSKIRLTVVGTVDEDGDILVSVRDVKRAIEQTPSADVVEVVRCKDCRYKSGICCPFYDGINKTDNDFCSYGIRNEQGEKVKK